MTPDDYQQVARELARNASMPDDVAGRMELDLVHAFDGAGFENPAPPRMSRPRIRRAGPSGPAKVLAAAAAVIIAVGAGLWYARQPVEQKPRPTEIAAVTPSTVVTPKVAVIPKVAVTPSVTTRRKPTPRHLPPVVQPAGFVPVPAAAGLPQFESGVIVRLSLPVTALPSYGVDISPASSGDSVEADVLVAQDGVARAIRLVNTSRSQQ